MSVCRICQSVYPGLRAGPSIEASEAVALGHRAEGGARPMGAGLTPGHLAPLVELLDVAFSFAPKKCFFLQPIGLSLGRPSPDIL